jgi:hypothetical protein
MIFVPQLPQKFEPGALVKPHSRHTAGRAAPQMLQKRIPSATSAAQLGHCIIVSRSEWCNSGEAVVIIGKAESIKLSRRRAA